MSAQTQATGPQRSSQFPFCAVPSVRFVRSDFLKRFFGLEKMQHTTSLTSIQKTAKAHRDTLHAHVDELLLFIWVIRLNYLKLIIEVD